MKIYDITQEIFTCRVYPGDTTPRLNEVLRIKQGALYNLTDFSMCAHNGTHIDAPFHFIDSGITVEAIQLAKTVGKCFVAPFTGAITAEDAKKIIANAASYSCDAAKRILIKGEAEVTEDAARVFAESELYLIGVESQSVGDVDAPMATHLILLEKEIVLLEGIRLDDVECGEYFLAAQPLPLGGSDGAPCRAILMSDM